MIALLGGLVIGLMLGAHRLSGDVAEPILVALYSIPKITLYPVILLLFGAAKLPGLARSVGQSARILKGEMRSTRTTADADADPTAPAVTRPADATAHHSASS